MVSVSSVHFMNQTERLLRKWREYFLDLKDMRLFLAIAEENNLTRAAQKTVTRSRRQAICCEILKQNSGFPVFAFPERTCPDAERRGTAFPDPADAGGGGIFGSDSCLHPGCPDRAHPDRRLLAASVQRLPPALKKFLTDYPDMTVEVLEGCSQEIEGWLEKWLHRFRHRRSPPGRKDGLASLEKEPYLAVCANDSPYAEYERFDLKKDLPKVSYIEEKGENRPAAPVPAARYRTAQASVYLAKHLLHARDGQPQPGGSASCRSWSSAIFLKMLSGCRSIRRWSACSASGFRQQKKRPQLPAC